MGICQSYRCKGDVLKLLSDQFMNNIAEKVNNGATFHLCFDNLDWRVHSGHLTAEKKNQDIHAVTTSYIVDNVDISHMEGENLDIPKLSIENVNKELFNATTEEQAKLRRDYIVLVSRVLPDHFEELDFMKKVANRPIIQKYKDEMAKKRICDSSRSCLRMK